MGFDQEISLTFQVRRLRRAVTQTSIRELSDAHRSPSDAHRAAKPHFFKRLKKFTQRFSKRRQWWASIWETVLICGRLIDVWTSLGNIISDKQALPSKSRVRVVFCSVWASRRLPYHVHATVSCVSTHSDRLRSDIVRRSTSPWPQVESVSTRGRALIQKNPIYMIFQIYEVASKWQFWKNRNEGTYKIGIIDD